MSRLTGKAPVRFTLVIAALVAGAAMIRARRRGEVWHTLDRDDGAGHSGDHEGP
jgi:hypothetical protein